jgi:hypothetical protein
MAVPMTEIPEIDLAPEVHSRSMRNAAFSGDSGLGQNLGEAK